MGAILIGTFGRFQESHSAESSFKDPSVQWPQGDISVGQNESMVSLLLNTTNCEKAI